MKTSKQAKNFPDSKLKLVKSTGFNSGTTRHKNKVILLILFLAAISVSTNVNSFTANSTGKTFDFAITSGNGYISGSNFKTFSVIGDEISTITSSNFKTEVGFLRTLPYLNGEPCRVNLECIGGFCCSNLCQSSACPTSETPASGTTSTAAGGGDSGISATSEVEEFSIDTNLIKALIKQGGTYQTKFTVKNTGTKELSFDIDYSALKELVLLSDTEFALAPNETKSIDVTIFASEEKKPDVYSGNIRIKAGNIEKALPVLIAVQAKKALFDIKIEVLPQYKYALKAENVAANITLINIGDLKPVDVNLYYAIRDIDGKDLVLASETFAVYDKIDKIKELGLPKDIQLGTYIFYVRASYITDTAAAGDIFYVVSQKPTCLDGIKNQNEESIDCGGICRSCKELAIPKIMFIITEYKLSIVIILVSALIVAILAMLYLKKRKEEIKKTEIRKKIIAVLAFINSALSRGFSYEQIKAMLLSRGLPQRLADLALDKAMERENRLVNYINKALSHGLLTTEIKKLLLEAGWPEAQIESHLSNLVEKRLKYL